MKAFLVYSFAIFISIKNKISLPLLSHKSDIEGAPCSYGEKM